MFGAVLLRAVRAALYELFVHSERSRAATQGVHMLNLFNIVLFYISWNILLYVLCCSKQPVMMCPYKLWPFQCESQHYCQVMKCCGAITKWNVAEPSRNEMLRSCHEMKCCRAVTKWNVAEPSRNEMLQSRLEMKCPWLNIEQLSERKSEQPLNTDRSSNSQHELVSNGKDVNYSILLGQCAPILGVCSGLDGTG